MHACGAASCLPGRRLPRNTFDALDHVCDVTCPLTLDVSRKHPAANPQSLQSLVLHVFGVRASIFCPPQTARKDAQDKDTFIRAARLMLIYIYI